MAEGLIFVVIVKGEKMGKEKEKIKISTLEDFFVNIRLILKYISYDKLVLLLSNDKILKLMIEKKLFFSNGDIIFPKLGVNKSIFFLDKVYFLNREEFDINFILLFNNFSSTYFYEKYLQYLKKYNIDIKKIIYLLSYNNIKINCNLFISVILKNQKNINDVINNLTYFLINNNKLLELKHILSSYNISNDIIDKYIENNPNLVITEIANVNKFKNNNINQEKYILLLTQIIVNLLNSKGLNFSNIEYLGSGLNSNAYKIGNEVLKINSKSKSFLIPNSDLFLSPLYSYTFKNEALKDTIFIEITKYAPNFNITKNDVFEVYKKIRDYGFIWTDCKKCNLGRLENGKIVILDSDYIYDADLFFNNPKKCQSGNFEIYKEYENRYRKINGDVYVR